MAIYIELYEADDIAARERNELVVIETSAGVLPGGRLPIGKLCVRITPQVAFRLSNELTVAARAANAKMAKRSKGKS